MFKNILKNLLENNDLSQYQLSKATGIPLTTISGWMNTSRLPDYTALGKLTTYFDVPAEYLLGLTDEWGNRKTAEECTEIVPIQVTEKAPSYVRVRMHEERSQSSKQLTKAINKRLNETILAKKRTKKPSKAPANSLTDKPKQD